jgi:ABC-type polysaccharide/polyol phosphate transport system ATPase subunit
VSGAVVTISGVGKRYVKYDDAPMLATALLRLRRRTRQSHLWAVQDLDLEVAAGECVGVIGRNGSGKSTLLQMISGITAPTVGRVRVHGRVAPLISVGVGFHPELSGRDNVYVNGTILGLTRPEIDNRFDAIVAFSELHDFIDTPVKFYSSGMAVRLGFAVAIQAQPDVLIVDEVLAVGDFAFQLKCFERIQAIRDGGATVLVVSHNLNAVRQMADRAMLLHRGRKQFEGDTTEAISRYHELLQEQREIEGLVENERRLPLESGDAELIDVTIRTRTGETSHHFDVGDEMVLRTRVRALKAVPSPYLSLILTNATGVVVYNDSNARDPYPPLDPGSERAFEIVLPAALPTGSYTARLVLSQTKLDNTRVRMAEDENVSFYVAGRRHVNGAADLGARFQSNGHG